MHKHVHEYVCLQVNIYISVQRCVSLHMCMSVSGYIVYLQVYILMSVSEYVCLQVYTCMNVCRCVYLQVYMCMSVSGYDVYLEVYRRMNVSGYVCFQVYLCSVCIDLSVFAEAHVCA